MWARQRKWAALLVIALSVGTAAALSAEPAQPPQQKSSCGLTVSEAVDQARRSLANPEAGSERTALGCLIEAVSALDAHKAEVTRRDGTTSINIHRSEYPLP